MVPDTYIEDVPRTVKPQASEPFILAPVLNRDAHVFEVGFVCLEPLNTTLTAVASTCERLTFNHQRKC